MINCQCDDHACKKVGEEGEVDNHIEDCSCYTCHHAIGKLRN